MQGITPITQSSARFTQTEAPTETKDETLYVYVQLRPGTQVVKKCVNHLNHLRNNHPSAEVSLAGLSHGPDAVALTIAINPGPSDQIAKFGEQAVAAFDFVNAVFTGMFDYLPQYTTAPSPDAATTAAKFPDLLGAPANAPTAVAV